MKVISTRMTCINDKYPQQEMSLTSSSSTVKDMKLFFALMMMITVIQTTAVSSFTLLSTRTTRNSNPVFASISKKVHAFPKASLPSIANVHSSIGSTNSSTRTKKLKLLLSEEHGCHDQNHDDDDDDEESSSIMIMGRRKFMNDFITKGTAATVVLSVLSSTTTSTKVQALDDNQEVILQAPASIVENNLGTTDTMPCTTGISSTTSIIASNQDNDNNNNNIKNNQLDFRYFIAGGGCASISHGFATPFDVIKTKIQAQPDTYNEGFLNTASTLIQNDGLSSLSTGLLPTIVGFGLEGAVKFGVYESLKPFCINLLQGLQLQSSGDMTLPYLLASIAAGAVASTMLCPMERARIRLVTQKKESNEKDDHEGGDISEKVGLVSLLGKDIFFYMFLIFFIVFLCVISFVVFPATYLFKSLGE